MHPTLQEFYNEINKWIKEGCHNHVAFIKSAGICHNLERYMRFSDKRVSGIAMDMAEQFLDAGLEFLMPFNESPEDYRNECNNNTVFLNHKRIKWVKDHANR